MENKYTPGPWHFFDENKNVSDMIIDEKGLIITHLNCDIRHSMNTIIANSKLMAAAPELLEALQTCWKSLQTYGEHPIIKIEVESAIKKATI